MTSKIDAMIMGMSVKTLQGGVASYVVMSTKTEKSKKVENQKKVEK